MNPAMVGHIIIGLEVLLGLWLLDKRVTKHIKKITLEFNGKDKHENGQGSQS